MAAFVIRLTKDLSDVHVTGHWPGDLVWGDSEANEVRVQVTRDGEPVDLTGCTAQGQMMRADGNTLIWNGSIMDSEAVVLLPASAYAVSGPATLNVVLFDGEAQTTLISMKLMVNATTSSAEVAPVDTVPDLQQLVAKIAEMEAATTNAVAAAAVANGAHDEFASGLAMAIGYTEKKQYIDFTTVESSKYWRVSNGAVAEGTSNDYKRYSAVASIPAGTYSFAGLSPSYCVIEYADHSAVTLRSLNDNSTSRSGTVTIPGTFTLYASTTASASWCAFVDGSEIPQSAVSGSVYDAESTRMDDAALENSNVVSIFESFVMIGDSLTAGFVSNGSGQTYTSAEAKLANRNWPSYFGLATGRTVTNLGKGSSAARDWRYGNQSLNVDISDADVDTYCYMVGLGVNDSRSSLTVGSESDIKTDKANNADTFYGNYDFVIRQLREYKSARISQAKIFVFTMQDSEANAEQYNAAIRYVASLYDDVHCIDLHDIYKKQLASSPLTDLWIGNHSRPLGYALLADMIRRAVNGYMCKHPTSFAYDPWEPLT